MRIAYSQVYECHNLNDGTRVGIEIQTLSVEHVRALIASISTSRTSPSYRSSFCGSCHTSQVDCHYRPRCEKSWQRRRRRGAERHRHAR